jgi:hypothetical protein
MQTPAASGHGLIIIRAHRRMGCTGCQKTLDLLARRDLSLANGRTDP